MIYNWWDYLRLDRLCQIWYIGLLGSMLFWAPESWSVIIKSYLAPNQSIVHSWTHPDAIFYILSNKSSYIVTKMKICRSKIDLWCSWSELFVISRLTGAWPKPKQPSYFPPKTGKSTPPNLISAKILHQSIVNKLFK